jgi:hypothetical protein
LALASATVPLFDPIRPRIGAQMAAIAYGLPEGWRRNVIRPRTREHLSHALGIARSLHDGHAAYRTFVRFLYDLVASDNDSKDAIAFLWREASFPFMSKTSSGLPSLADDCSAPFRPQHLNFRELGQRARALLLGVVERHAAREEAHY